MQDKRPYDQRDIDSLKGEVDRLRDENLILKREADRLEALRKTNMRASFACQRVILGIERELQR